MIMAIDFSQNDYTYVHSEWKMYSFKRVLVHVKWLDTQNMHSF